MRPPTGPQPETPRPDADKRRRRELDSLTRLAHRVDPKRHADGRFRRREKGEK
jgi:hypothetical protein